MYTGFEFEAAEDGFAADQGDDFLETTGITGRAAHGFNFPALLLSVTAVHSKEIACKSPISIRGTKEMLLYSRDHSVHDGLNYIATWNAGMLSQQDLMAGIAAQAERKVADYED